VITLKSRSELRTGLLYGLSACIVAICAVRTPPASAVTQWIPIATGGVEYNSNVFSLPGGTVPTTPPGNTQLGDVIGTVLGGINTDSLWGGDHLQLNLQGERFDYAHFTALSHNEYRLGGNFDWFSGPLLDGTLSFTQARTMTAPADTLSEQLEIQVDKVATATFRLGLTPVWRLDFAPRWHQLESPLPDYPDFGLHEAFAAASLNYLGIAKLTAGARFEYGDGIYHGIVGATRYHQTTAGFTAQYAVTGLSSFNGQVGYTNRNSSFVNPADAAATIPVAAGGGTIGTTSTLTGSLGVHRQISVKTSVDFKLFREVDSYVAGANSEIGTGGSISAQWSPDFRFDIAARYSMETEDIQGDLATFNVLNRTDHVRSAGLDVRYHATHWLTLRPYFSRDQRSSSLYLANYSMNQVGLDLIAKFDSHK
jgi:hypothetical protein